MKLGVMAGGRPREASLDSLVERARRVEGAGFATLWIPHIFGPDALTAAAVVGRETQRLEIGTAVVPSYPRHPVAMAQQALTTNAAAGGRFTLGIGLSHRVLIEDMFGLSYARPARHMREYLEVLGPLLRGEKVRHEGELYRVRAALDVPGGAPTELVVAALGPAMLRLAGRRAQGTITWMTGVRTLESYVVPRIRAAAEEVGRPVPRVIAGLPIALTTRPDAAREKIAGFFAGYDALPSYRAMLDREGVDGPGDVALVGDEAALRAQLGRLRDAGVTDLEAAISPVEPDAADRTFDFLASL